VEEFCEACSADSSNTVAAAGSPLHTFESFVHGSRAGLNGFDCHCPFDNTHKSVAWLRSMLQIIVNFDSLWPSFGCVLCSIPVLSGTCDGMEFSREVASFTLPLHNRWQFRCGVSVSSVFGDIVSVYRWILFGVRRRPGRTHYLSFPPTVPESKPFASIVDGSLDDPADSLFTFRGMSQEHWTANNDEHPFAFFFTPTGPYRVPCVAVDQSHGCF
jgi:hypothetical protein